MMKIIRLTIEYIQKEEYGEHIERTSKREMEAYSTMDFVAMDEEIGKTWELHGKLQKLREKLKGDVK